MKDRTEDVCTQKKEKKNRRCLSGCPIPSIKRILCENVCMNERKDHATSYQLHKKDDASSHQLYSAAEKIDGESVSLNVLQTSTPSWESLL